MKIFGIEAASSHGCISRYVKEKRKVRIPPASRERPKTESDVETDNVVEYCIMVNFRITMAVVAPGWKKMMESSVQVNAWCIGGVDIFTRLPQHLLRRSEAIELRCEATIASSAFSSFSTALPRALATTYSLRAPMIKTNPSRYLNEDGAADEFASGNGEAKLEILVEETSGGVSVGARLSAHEFFLMQFDQLMNAGFFKNGGL